jgi:hypothetical protein
MITESQAKPTKREVPSSRNMEEAFAAGLAADLLAAEKAREDLTEKEKTSLIAIKKYFFDKDGSYFSDDRNELQDVIKQKITFQQIKDRHAGALAIQEAGNTGKNKDKIMKLMDITSEKDWQKLQNIATDLREEIRLNEENKNKEKLENARKIVEEAFEADKKNPKDISVNE